MRGTRRKACGRGWALPAAVVLEEEENIAPAAAAAAGKAAPGSVAVSVLPAQAMAAVVEKEEGRRSFGKPQGSQQLRPDQAAAGRRWLVGVTAGATGGRRRRSWCAWPAATGAAVDSFSARQVLRERKNSQWLLLLFTIHAPGLLLPAAAAGGAVL